MFSLFLSFDFEIKSKMLCTSQKHTLILIHSVLKIEMHHVLLESMGELMRVIHFRRLLRRRSIISENGTSSVRPICIGTYKRYHTCNTQVNRRVRTSARLSIRIVVKNSWKIKFLNLMWYDKALNTFLVVSCCVFKTPWFWACSFVKCI